MSCGGAIDGDGSPVEPPTAHATGRFKLRVDEAWKSSLNVEMAMGDASYAPVPARDAYEVVLDGEEVTVRPLFTGRPVTYRGTRSARGEYGSPVRPGERRFSLVDGSVTGELVIYGEGRAEVTRFGWGVPIVSSERGVLRPL